jgi:hypothetical protein
MARRQPNALRCIAPIYAPSRHFLWAAEQLTWRCHIPRPGAPAEDPTEPGEAGFPVPPEVPDGPPVPVDDPDPADPRPIHEPEALPIVAAPNALVALSARRGPDRMPFAIRDR